MEKHAMTRAFLQLKEAEQPQNWKDQARLVGELLQARHWQHMRSKQVMPGHQGNTRAVHVYF